MKNLWVAFGVLFLTSILQAKPGDKSPYPHVVMGAIEGYTPALGYIWATTDPNDVEVIWKPRMRYPELHIVTTTEEGVFVPELGYRWKNTKQRNALSLGEVAAGLAVIATIHELSGKFGRDFDRWLPEKGPSTDSKGRESIDHNTGGGGGGSFGGTGGGRSTGPGAQDRK